jgi:hypothetical protein
MMINEAMLNGGRRLREGVVDLRSDDSDDDDDDNKEKKIPK